MILRRVVQNGVTRNAALNLAGLAAPLAVAFFVLPVLIRALGPARFGLLGVGWAFLEYLTLFDVGLGKATVRYVADDLARGTDDVSQITAVSLASQIGIGTAAALALAAAAPWLARDVFRVDAALAGEGGRFFAAVACNLPVVLAVVTLRGVLEGAQRFDVSNAIKIPASASSVVIPAIAALYGASLPAIMGYLFVARIVTALVTLWAVRRVLPAFRMEWPREWRRLRGLISFGGWVAVSGVVSPLLVYFDRFALGARHGYTAVGYYTAPYEAVTRLLMIPNALTGALFPLLTGLSVAAATARIDRLFATSMQRLVLMVAGPAIVACAFAPELLRWWVGAAYATAGAPALRILAVGVVINATAHLPYTFLEAAGRPDVPAKCHLTEIVVHLPVAWWLTGVYGITGAALAWTIRVTLDTTLLLVAANRIVPVSLRAVFTGHRTVAPAT